MTLRIRSLAFSVMLTCLVPSIGSAQMQNDSLGGDTPQRMTELLQGCLGAGNTPSQRRDICTTLLDSEILSTEGRATALAYRAAALLDLFDYTAALRDFTDALDLAPNNIGFLDGRARTFDAMGEHQKAIQDYDLALQIAPKVAALYAGRASSHAQMGNFDAALRDLDQAQKIDPLDINTLVTLGNLNVELKQFDTAQAAYTKAIEIEPNRHRLYTRRGLAYLFGGNPTEAITDFSFAIDHGEATPDAYMFRGMANQRTDNIDAALADYTQAINLDPTRAVAWHRRGMIYMDRKDYQQAYENLNVAVQIQPISDYYNSIAWLLVAAEDKSFRDPKAALDYVEKSLNLDENADNADTAAAVHTLLGDQGQAMKFYRLSMELGGADRVQMYQEYLQKRGYYQGPIDGQIDEKIEAAIQAFSEEALVLLVD